MREGLHKIVDADQTIVAISTPLGRSGLGVIRMSGGDALSIGQRFFRASTSEIEPRRATLGRWTNDAEVIDEVVLTYFQAPRSYTGEDVVEISAHGNPLTLNCIVRCVLQAGARIAEPGEFTLRAVSHGKMDLVQAEAVPNNRPGLRCGNCKVPYRDGFSRSRTSL
jgi:tRNA modification GTPase